MAFLLFNPVAAILNAQGAAYGPLLPAHFDALDCLFAVITLFVILKFVNSLRPILGE